MKILISQRDLTAGARNFEFDALERSWYAFLKGHTLIPVPNLKKVDIDIEFDCLVLTGGPDSIARHITEDLLFHHALTKSKPILGVCHGAFAVNDLTGGVNGRVMGHEDCDHEIVMDGKKYTVNSYHSQSIAVLGANMLATAHDSQGNIEAFEHVELPIYGIVWHPERMDLPVLTKSVEQLIRSHN